MRLDQQTVEILDASRVVGNTFYLPDVTLSRDTYLKVNKALEAMGGRWNKKAKGHVFDLDPSEVVEAAITSGECENWRKALQFFPTPLALADRLAEMAGVEDDHLILEPSAGRGGILDALPIGPNLHVCEISPESREFIRTVYAGVTFVGEDFLGYTPGPIYDRIVANPPFSRQQDIDHVRHMWGCLKPGGRLVSVMSDGARTRGNRKSCDFREFVHENGGTIEPLPENSFRSSGTNVNACVVSIQKAA